MTILSFVNNEFGEVCKQTVKNYVCHVKSQEGYNNHQGKSSICERLQLREDTHNLEVS